MAPRFYSKEWLEAVIEKTNSDKQYLDKAKKLTGAFLSVITECPDGNDVKVWIKFDKGKVVDYEYKAEPAPASFRIENEPWDEAISLVKAQGTYDTFKKIQMKEMNPMQAMGSGLYKSDGNMVQLIKLMPYNKAYTDLQTTVDCEY